MPQPTHDRPRERLLREGASALTVAELLAVLLGTGGGGIDALAAGAVLAARFPDLRRLAVAGLGELTALPGVGTAQACRVKAALALAARLAERPYARGEPCASPDVVFERIGRALALSEKETFVALSLDPKLRVLGEHRIAEGGVCHVAFECRDAFAPLVREGAARTIFLHNHPSGDPSPSPQDLTLFERLDAAAATLGIPVVDHLIVTVSGYHSASQTRGALVGEGGARSGQAITRE